MLGGWLFFRREKDSNLAEYIKSFSDTSPEATAIGYNVKLPVMTSAFVNGSLVETLDWQDCVISASLHSCSGTTPAVLALGENLKINGRQVIEAVAAGYESGTRIGKALMPSVWRKGFETTGNVGAVGAAMAAGRLLGMNGEESASLLGIASYIAPIAYCDGVFHGFSMKPIHGGAAAQTGIQAALLKKSGFDGSPLEGLPPIYYGFMNVLSDDPKFDLLTDDLGEKWLMRELGFKKYPVGLLIIGPVYVTLELVKENNLKPSDIKGVNVISYSDTYHFVGRHYTNTSSSHHDCVLSLPYCVAAAISDREMGMEQLLSTRIRDSKVHELAKRVTCEIDKSMDEIYPKDWPVFVEITTNDGTILSSRLDKVIGSPSQPMSTNDIMEKFQIITGPILGEEGSKKVCERVLEIENIDDISILFNYLAPIQDEG